MRTPSIFFLAIVFGIVNSSRAQHVNSETSTASAVESAVRKLFEGMRTGDSTMVRNAFGAEVTLATVATNKAGKLVLERESSVDGFVTAVGTPHTKAWNEETWNYKVLIDGDFAQVWCDYAFYLGDTFSHCGVDAFHLYRMDGEWKIFHLADTRRTVDCNIPLTIKARHDKK